jgi:uncharacterized protein
MNILKSKYIMMIPGINGSSKYPLLFLLGWPYVSDPESLHVVALGNDGIPKEILNLKNFDLDSFADLDKNSTLELIGNPCTECGVKHGIRFSDAESVLFDPMALTREDMDTEGEQRFTSIGVDATGRLLVVVFSYRSEQIRLISARPATAKEREYYES